MNVPLADFYATWPYAKESPVDYWVRLNNAAEITDSHLQKQGSRMQNISNEISVMFIGNFPDAELTSVFRYKPITKWTFAEVQEAIDERQRELRTKNAASFTRKNHTFQVATAAISQAEIVQGDSTAVNASEPEAITETTHAATNDTGALE